MLIGVLNDWRCDNLWTTVRRTTIGNSLKCSSARRINPQNQEESTDRNANGRGTLVLKNKRACLTPSGLAQAPAGPHLSLVRRRCIESFGPRSIAAPHIAVARAKPPRRSRRGGRRVCPNSFATWGSPWWNPAVERQAMDRARRIGKDRPVFVHRLIAENNVEAAIQRMQARRQSLADELFGPA